MKKIIVGITFCVCVMLLVPLMSFKKASKPLSVQASGGADFDYTETVKASYRDTFSVKDSKTGNTTKLSADDYIFCVVAAEMPVLYEEEALKAQAVAAYTFACFKAESRKGEDYDVTTDSHIDQAFVSKETLKERWGEDYEKYSQKISKVISSVRGTLLTYNGSTALAAYHAISNGVTNSCKDVWSKDIPYLTSVDSSWDKTASKYIDNKLFSPSALSEKIKELAAVSGDEGKYISDIKKTSSGLVKSIKICGKEVKGTKLAAALDLRSATFDVKFKDGAYAFTVYGYGHGVGMSQNGANYMAKQGSTYEEILLHYYKGCKLKHFN